ncbi:magnesium transporter CorA family protein [Candidatus Woesearchaeota archaeon]|jgi:magnesium transporter|nr:magnesium transporter CorA family protein [Candidatus Woesearchaeota archaeon]MBT6519156.1 magnesium transporter CorA family protein [Candidatus Woesearchaeota archaeon]MBT7367793.1 magnesium transporter CorA family protein [Candidatus Woesearchaeota archaeon]
MIKYFKKTINERDLKELPNFEVGCWINVINPSLKELKKLATDYDLDFDLLEEGIDEYELPRLDIEDDSKYIFIKTISKKKLNTLLIVIAEKFILTITKEEPDFFKKIVNNQIKITTTQKLKSLIKILSIINDEFEKRTTDIVRKVQRKKTTTTKLKAADMENLLEYEDALNNLVSTYYYKSTLYEKLIKKIKFYEDDKDEIEDLLVDSNQGLNLCRISLKSISNIRNYYSIIITNNLNKTIKILTIFTILISIPAAISGIYGMNIGLPLQQDPFAFAYVLGIITLIIVSFIIFLRKKDVL